MPRRLPQHLCRSTIAVAENNVAVDGRAHSQQADRRQSELAGPGAAQVSVNDPELNRPYSHRRSHPQSEPGHAIGAGAVNQAIKAIAISRGYVVPAGLDLVCIPSFIDLSLDGQERTGIRLLVEVR